MKNKFILFTLTFIFSVAFIIFSLFTYFRADTTLKNPLGLSENFVELQISPPFDPQLALDVEIAHKVKEEMYKIVKNKNIVMVYWDIEDVGLGLYDPINFYKSNLLKEGDMFSAVSVKDIIIKEDSYSYDYNVKRLGRNYIEDMIEGKKLNILGVYDSRHPLYDKTHEYIYNYFSKANNIFGFYYFDSNSKEEVNQIVSDIQKMLQKYGYLYDITDKGFYRGNLKNIISSMLLSKIYLPVFIAFIFVCVNLYFFYYILLRNQKKVMIIHSIFGATNVKLLVRYTREILKYLFLSSVLVAIFYKLFFASTVYDVSIKTLSIVVLANVLLGYAIWFLAFLTVDYRLNRKDGVYDYAI